MPKYNKKLDVTPYFVRVWNISNGWSFFIEILVVTKVDLYPK